MFKSKLHVSDTQFKSRRSSLSQTKFTLAPLIALRFLPQNTQSSNTIHSVISQFFSTSISSHGTEKVKCCVILRSYCDMNLAKPGLWDLLDCKLDCLLTGLRRGEIRLLSPSSSSESEERTKISSCLEVFLNAGRPSEPLLACLWTPRWDHWPPCLRTGDWAVPVRFGELTFFINGVFLDSLVFAIIPPSRASEDVSWDRKELDLSLDTTCLAPSEESTLPCPVSELMSCITFLKSSEPSGKGHRSTGVPNSAGRFCIHCWMKSDAEVSG